MGWFSKKGRSEPTEAPPPPEPPTAIPPGAEGSQAFPSPETDPAQRHQDLMGAVINTVVASPQLADPAWAMYALAAEVSDGRVALSAYRYTDDGRAVATEPPDDFDAFGDLWRHTRDTVGTPWDVLLVKIHRDSGSFVTTFHYGEDADRYRITPATIADAADRLRPTPDDFADPA